MKSIIIFAIILFSLPLVQAGTDTIGTATSTGSINGYVMYMNITATNCVGTLNSVGLNWYAGQSNAERVAIYDLNQNLLGQSVNTSVSGGWADANISGVTLTAGTKYGIAVQTMTGSEKVYYVGSGSNWDRTYSYGSFPNPSGALSTWGATLNMRMTCTPDTNIYNSFFNWLNSATNWVMWVK